MLLSNALFATPYFLPILPLIRLKRTFSLSDEAETGQNAPHSRRGVVARDINVCV
jgi:hypothetical protein